MRKGLPYLLCLLAFGFGTKAQLMPGYGGSRVGTTGMQFLKIGVDARSAGLANTFSAVTNDVSALYWNPSGLMLMDTQKVQFQFGRTNYFAGIGINYGGLVLRGAESAWGISIVNLTTGDMNETTEFQPNGTGRTFSANSLLIGLTHARQLTDNFSFGFTTKYARESIASMYAQNVMFDLGLMYNIAEKRMRFAVSISNFGFNVKPDGSFTWLRLNGQNTSSSFEDMAVPAMFRIGYAYDAIKKGKNQLTTSIQLNHPTDNSETLGIGAEYSWNKMLFLRSGYEFGVDEQTIPAAGVGVQFQRRFGVLRLDYSYNNRDRLGAINRLTLNVGLF